jgi:hypothetical protein
VKLTDLRGILQYIPQFREKTFIIEVDGGHHTEDDPGKPYEFRDADTLLQDLFREVRRVLSERGISKAVVRAEERRK